jgi:hypothetical protein
MNLIARFAGGYGCGFSAVNDCRLGWRRESGGNRRQVNRAGGTISIRLSEAEYFQSPELPFVSGEILCICANKFAKAAIIRGPEPGISVALANYCLRPKNLAVERGSLWPW